MSRVNKFIQPADGVHIISIGDGPNTLLTPEVIEEGRRRIAAGEDPDKVALELAQIEVDLLEDVGGEDLHQSNEEERILASKETALHAAADAHVPTLSVALRHAFAMGRRATKKGQKPDIEKIVKAISTALTATLPRTLLKVVAAGGAAGVEMLGELRTSEEHRALAEKIKFAFNVANPAVVKWAKEHAADLVTQITDTTRDRLKLAIEELGEEGDWDLATDRITAAIGDPERAELIARHECLPGETLVDSAVVNAVHRRWYEGDVAEICTCNGRQFTTTPNHPMLTNRGWVAAGQIQENDDLICDIRQQNVSSTRNNHVTAPPTTLREIFNAAASIGAVERSRCVQLDFHGDGRDGDVDIAYPFGPLMIGEFSPLYEPLLNLFLSESNETCARFCDTCRRLLPINESICFCHRTEMNTGLSQDTLNYMTINTEEILEAFNRLVREIPANNFLVRQIFSSIPTVLSLPERQLASVGVGTCRTGQSHNILNPRLVSRHDLSDLSATQTRQIQLDSVISIRLRSFRGHVYNLSTPFGYFTIKGNDSQGGVYTGNTMLAASEGQRQAWDQAVEKGLLTGDEQRTWIVVGDDKVCPICEALDGKTAGLGEEYDDGIVGPPAHVACRCTEGIASLAALGGPGSGHFGHAGRPGEVGGSAPTGTFSEGRFTPHLVPYAHPKVGSIDIDRELVYGGMYRRIDRLNDVPGIEVISTDAGHPELSGGKLSTIGGTDKPGFNFRLTDTTNEREAKRLGEALRSKDTVVEVHDSRLGWAIIVESTITNTGHNQSELRDWWDRVIDRLEKANAPR